MARWKKNQKEFLVGVNYHEKRGAQASIPKPVIKALGHPSAIVFVLKAETIEVRRAKKHLPPEIRHLEHMYEGERL